MYMIACYVVGYILYYIDTSFSDGNTFLPEPERFSLILRRQIWRLVIWIILSIITRRIFAVCDLDSLLLLSSGKSSGESDRYLHICNLYIFGGIILTIIGAFVVRFYRRRCV